MGERPRLDTIQRGLEGNMKGVVGRRGSRYAAISISFSLLLIPRPEKQIQPSQSSNASPQSLPPFPHNLG